MSEVCKDELPADRCSAKNNVCKACGSKEVMQEDHGTNSWERIIVHYCNECEENNCVCSCAIPECCEVCLNVEPCGCSYTAY